MYEKGTMDTTSTANQPRTYLRRIFLRSLTTPPPLRALSRYIVWKLKNMSTTKTRFTSWLITQSPSLSRTRKGVSAGASAPRHATSYGVTIAVNNKASVVTLSHFCMKLPSGFMRYQGSSRMSLKCPSLLSAVGLADSRSLIFSSAALMDCRSFALPPGFTSMATGGFSCSCPISVSVGPSGPIRSQAGGPSRAFKGISPIG
mmetsp:Transcript_23006/g.51881  ORF Transcript_23006/g.51881 Transcript_23006/m.51881 type:complete len:202 (-) Transcript_23006:214-819(-)